MTEAIALPALTLRSRSGRLVTDDRLVNRASKGDEQAFAVIYERYHQDLFRYCQAMLGNPSDAQDALQNTMVKALQALPGEKREIKLKPWLYRIAHNEAINLMRRRHPGADIDSASTAAIDAGPYESAETKERLHQLANDLGELPERQRSALVLRELSGLRFEEIGATLGATPAVIRQTIYEARTSLQRMKVGREMGCETVKQALSDGDGRVLRRRDMSSSRGLRELRGIQGRHCGPTTRPSRSQPIAGGGVRGAVARSPRRQPRLLGSRPRGQRWRGRRQDAGGLDNSEIGRSSGCRDRSWSHRRQQGRSGASRLDWSKQQPRQFAGALDPGAFCHHRGFRSKSKFGSIRTTISETSSQPQAGHTPREDCGREVGKGRFDPGGGERRSWRLDRDGDKSELARFPRLTSGRRVSWTGDCRRP